MAGLSQRKIADVFRVSQPTVCGWLQQAGVPSDELDKPAVRLLALCIGELSRCNLSGPEAAGIIGRCQKEIAYLFGGEGRKAWLMLFRDARDPDTLQFEPVTDEARLVQMQSFLPVSTTISLTEIVRRALATMADLEGKGEVVGHA